MLMREQDEGVKRAICGIISAISNIELQSGGWPEIVDTIKAVQIAEHFNSSVH